MKTEVKEKVKVRVSGTVSVSGTPQDPQRTSIDGEKQSWGAES